MIIKVEHKDVVESINKNFDPITIVLKKKFGKNISVSRNFIRIKDGRKKQFKLIPLPKEATDFLLDYNISYFTYKYGVVEEKFAGIKFKLDNKVVKLLRE